MASINFGRALALATGLSLPLAGCEGLTASQCEDGIDNDGNGLIDCDDDYCSPFCIERDDVTSPPPGGEDEDGDGYAAGDDCNDSDAAINPGATENCDGLDNDCDNEIDEGVTQTFYSDEDGDTFGDPDESTEACEAVKGWVPTAGDCDDGDDAISPGAEELCDGIDNDCNEIVDDGLTSSTYYPDSDADGFGDPSKGLTACDQPDGYVDDETDCDDADASIHPNATEVPYNGIDEDCASGDLTDVDGDSYDGGAGGDDCDDEDASIHPNATEVPYNGIDEDCAGGDLTDVDGDSYDGGAGGDDCDDIAAAINPGAAEVCNDSVDNDCDASTPDVFDGDGDGADCSLDCDDGNASVSPGQVELCDDSIDNDCNAGTLDLFDGDSDGSACNVDCNDAVPETNPSATEVCDDGVDNDCNPLTTDIFDGDGDGSDCDADCDDNDALVYPGAPEICDDIDSDCDGLPDSAEPDIGGWGPTSVMASPNAPIVDYSTTVSQVSVTAPLLAEVGQATVLVNLLHTYLGDLTITLIAPNGTEVVLMHWDGQYGDNLANTLFTDEASVGINGQPGSGAPFTGSFRPEQPLSNLLAVDPNGLWTLEVHDDSGGDVGTLVNWTLTLGDNDDFDGDGFVGSCGDCDDEDDAVNPGATEVCENGIDDDCDASTPDSCTAFCAEGDIYAPTGNCFVYVSTGAPWSTAQADCVAMGGYLAVVDDAAENTFARDTSILTVQAWIGFFDTGTGTAANAFQDVTGGNGTSDYSNWLPGEPNGNPNEDCVAYFETPFADPYTWNDAVCTLPYPYICEIDGP
jgi:subtilisin-like proprotein convertase family protein